MKNSNVQIEFTRRAADQYAKGVGCYSVQDAIQAVIDQDHAEAFRHHYFRVISDAPTDHVWKVEKYARKGDYEMACSALYDLRSAQKSADVPHPLVKVILEDRRRQGVYSSIEGRSAMAHRISALEYAARLTLGLKDLALLFPNE